jgi:hypothetical protein
MPALQLTDVKLTRDVLREWWQRQDEQCDPLEELLRLERMLSQLEWQHGLDSAEFYHRFQSGEMGDDLTYVRWAGQYQLYLNLKQTISASLRLVVTQYPVAV